MDQHRIQSLLTDLFLEGFPQGMRERPLALFGSPRQASHIVRFLAALGRRPSRILVNNPSGPAIIEGVPVVRAGAEAATDCFVLVLSTVSFQAIAKQLEAWGLRREIDFTNFFCCFEDSTKRDTFSHFARTSKELLHVTEELHPWFVNTSAARNLRSFLTVADAVSRAGGSFLGQTVLEVGCGNTLVPALSAILLGAERVTALDISQQDNLYHSSQYSDLAAYLVSHFDELPFPHSTPGHAMDSLLDALRFEGSRITLAPSLDIRIPCDVCSVASEKARYGVIFSTVVFEHIERPERAIAAIAAASSPGATAFHQIDLSGHAGEDGQPRFYSLSREECRERFTELNVNTLRKSELERLFTQHGFEILDSSPGGMLPLESLDRSVMHPDFAGMSDEDLRCMYVSLSMTKR